MDCPKCGYAMDAFDQECPRCKRFGDKVAKQEPAPPPAEPTPPVPPSAPSRPFPPIEPRTQPRPTVAQPAPVAGEVSNVGWRLLWAVLGVIVIGGLWKGCSPMLQSMKPYQPHVAYVKDTVALKEGDGVTIYLILADESGKMTKAQGNASVQIDLKTNVVEDFDVKEVRKTVFTKEMNVYEKDFLDTEVGLGAFKHPATILPFPRVSFAEMGINPKDYDFAMLEVSARFIEGIAGAGNAVIDRTQALEGEDSLPL